MGEPVTVELDSESIAAAKEAGIDLSKSLVEALRRKLPKLHAAEREKAAREWYEETRTLSIPATNSLKSTRLLLYWIARSLDDIAHAEQHT